MKIEDKEFIGTVGIDNTNPLTVAAKEKVFFAKREETVLTVNRSHAEGQKGTRSGQNLHDAIRDQGSC